MQNDYVNYHQYLEEHLIQAGQAWILASSLGLSPNLLSHHLRVLERAGLVSHRRGAMDARWIYYTADEAAIASWQQWFSRFLNPIRSQRLLTLLGPEGRQTVD